MECREICWLAQVFLARERAMIFLGLTPKLPALTCYVVFLYTFYLLYLRKAAFLSSSGKSQVQLQCQLLCEAFSHPPSEWVVSSFVWPEHFLYVSLFPLSTCPNLICVRLVFPTGFWLLQGQGSWPNSSWYYLVLFSWPSLGSQAPRSLRRELLWFLFFYVSKKKNKWSLEKICKINGVLTRC